MPKLVTHVGGHRGCLGLSLRGNCTTPADAAQLAQAASQLLTTRTPHLWVDCQQLLALSGLGQQAILQADRQARAAGSICYWCGLPPHLHAQLAHTGLELLPAASFQGPSCVLAVPARSHARTS